MCFCLKVTQSVLLDGAFESHSCCLEAQRICNSFVLLAIILSRVSHVLTSLTLHGIATTEGECGLVFGTNFGTRSMFGFRFRFVHDGKVHFFDIVDSVIIPGNVLVLIRTVCSRFTIRFGCHLAYSRAMLPLTIHSACANMHPFCTRYWKVDLVEKGNMKQVLICLNAVMLKVKDKGLLVFRKGSVN
jgi:hypothetical protein